MTKTIPEQQRNQIIHIFATEKQEKDDWDDFEKATDEFEEVSIFVSRI